jgi:2-aminoadipate transaminase
VQAKQGADLHTATFTQMVAYEVARGGFIDEHVQLIRRVYSERRDVMLRAMEEHFPEGVRWTRPLGGLFLWVTLPQEIDTGELLKEALDRKVAFVPGGPFHPTGDGANTFRLNFSSSTPEQIVEGIRRLGIVLHETVKMGTPEKELVVR